MAETVTEKYIVNRNYRIFSSHIQIVLTIFAVRDETNVFSYLTLKFLQYDSLCPI